jgi:DNA-binding transcriptional LysR family regulator
MIQSSEILMNPFPWYATELFLRICEAGGLSAASRHGRIGISQPALSGQMATLEQHLGVKLFERKPFQLTAQGRQFQEEALRLRTRMGLLEHALAQGTEKPLRIAAADVIIRNYLPLLLKQIDHGTRTRLVLREAPSQDLAGLVRDGEADIAIGALSRHVHQGTTPLVEVIARPPFFLHVPPSYRKKIKQWTDLMPLLRSEQPGLISLPQDSLIGQHINAALRKSRVEWHPTVEVCSLSHVPAYVDLDFGFGFGILTADVKASPHFKHCITIPTDRIPAMPIGVWYHENLDPTAQHLLALIRQMGKRIG